MKKKILLFLMIIAMLFSGKTVFAEEAEELETMKAGDYRFIVEKFAIRLYPFNIEEKTNEDTGEKYYTTTEEDAVKYQNGEYAEEIEIPLSDVTMHPSTYLKSREDLDMQIVELNTDFTTRKVKQILEGKATDVSSAKRYMGELVVYYKVIETPTGYDKTYSLNYYRYFLYVLDYLFSSNSEERLGFTTGAIETGLNETTSQVINTITITEEAGIEYKMKVDEGGELLLNFFALAKDSDEELEAERPGVVTGNIYHGLMFTNVSDTDNLVQMLFAAEEPNDENDEMETDPFLVVNKGKTTVPIPNTYMNHNQIILIIGVIIMVLGIGVVSHTVNKKD